MFTIRRKQPSRVRRSGGVEHYTAQTLSTYVHSTQIQKHLIPQSCVLVVLVKDLTRGGAMRAVISGSPSMDPFALLDQLTAGMLMLHQAIRYTPEVLQHQQEESLIVKPGGVNLPPFVQRG